MSGPGIFRPGIDRLLIASALDGDLRRRLLDSPDDVFPEFDLTEDEKDILRSPDQRLLPLLGAALARQSAATALAPLHAVIQVSVVQTQGAIGLSAALLQSSNMSAPPPQPPVAGDLRSASVQTAIAAVRSASSQDRRARIVDLLRALRGGEDA